MPSEALAEAEMITRAKPRPNTSARPFGIHEVARIGLAGNRHVGGEHAGIIVEARRKLADTRLPVLLVELQLGRGLDRHRGRLDRKIVRAVLFRHLHLGVGLDADEPLGGGAIGAVGLQPQAALDGVGVVLEGQGGGRGPSNAAAPTASACQPHVVVIVELGRAYAHRDIQFAALAPVGRVHACPACRTPTDTRISVTS